MSPTTITLIMFSSMILLLFTGRQVFIIIGGVACFSSLFLWPKGGIEMVWFATFNVTTYFMLLAIPLFILMANLILHSGVAEDLYTMIYHWMGPVRGGLAIGTVCVSAVNAAMIGETAAATTTAGVVAIPPMLKRGYDKLMISGVVQAGGALGILIPPSLSFIIYAIIARQSVGYMWVAGVMPGLLLVSLYIAYIAIRCYIQPHLGPPLPPEERVGWRIKFAHLKAGILPVFLVFIVLGFFFMGVTSLIECSATGAAGALIIAAFRRKLNWQILWQSLDGTLRISTFAMWIFMVAILYSAVYDGLGAVHAVERLFANVGGRWTILILMQLSFFVLGMVLDDYAMLIIVAPLYIPLVVDLGFSPVWFGVLYVINCQMAYLTPPFGYNLFIMRGIAPPEITMIDIYKSVIPFIIIQAACLAIVMAFPQIALWLPGIVFK